MKIIILLITQFSKIQKLSFVCLEFTCDKIKPPTCKTSLVMKDYLLLARCTEVEVNLDPSHTATVYCRAISEVETGLDCAAFPTAVFGTATDPRCYYSGYPWRRGYQNTAIPVDTCSTERSVDPVPTANSGPRSVGTTQNTQFGEQDLWSPRYSKDKKLSFVFFRFITR